MSGRNENGENVYSMWPNVSRKDLYFTLNDEQKDIFEELESVPRNSKRCKTSLKNVYRKLATGEYEGITREARGCASCKDYQLNYIWAKIINKASQPCIGNEPEHGAVNHHRWIFEKRLKKLIPFTTRVEVYHEVNGNWLYSVYAGALLPITAFARRHQKVAAVFKE